MEIRRDKTLQRLISKMHNGRVKIITGIRRCGKSYLLSHLFKAYLLSQGIHSEQIIEIALDKKQFVDLRHPELLYQYVLKHAPESSMQYYVFIDEIQLSYKVKHGTTADSQIADDDVELSYTTFYDILNDLMTHDNLDIYVTGSNSKMLSTDIATNFRDRGTEIRLFPLSFGEYYPVSGKEKGDAWEDYMVYGGMPLAVLEPDENEKAKYLSGLFKKLYIADIVERYKCVDMYVEHLIDVISSSIGSLTNPVKLANTLNSVCQAGTTDKTVKKYLDILEDSFLFHRAERYDVKGKKYLNSPYKYYAMDVGLRNARLNFRQVESTHIMENIIFNELVLRGYAVDVGAVRFAANDKDGVQKQTYHEIDFVVNQGNKKIYIQSAFAVPTEEKYEQEVLPLMKTNDFFKKIVIVSGNRKPMYDKNGILFIGIIPFLLDESCIDY